MCEVPVVEAGTDGPTAFISAAVHAKIAGILRIKLLEGVRQSRGAKRPRWGCPAETPELTTLLWSKTGRHGTSWRIPPGKLRKAAPEAQQRRSRWTKNLC